MIRRTLCVLIISLCWLTAAPGQLRPFAELWNNLAYYDTNLERRGFSSLLGRLEGKVGLFVFETPLQIYGAYYLSSSQAPDYWDNVVYYGPGIRFKPFEGYKGSGWWDEWIRGVKVFVEGLSSYYLKDSASAEKAGLAKTDTRYGLDLWHEWNLDKPDPSNFWGELWSNLSYRTTNFGWPTVTGEAPSFNDYIFYFQPKIGRHLGRGIELYLKADITMSGKDYYWLNVAAYGVGIRFEPWRVIADKDSILKKFKMFAEVLSVSYLKDKPADLLKTVTGDVRFGIDFSYGR